MYISDFSHFRERPRYFAFYIFSPLRLGILANFVHSFPSGIQSVQNSGAQQSVWLINANSGKGLSFSG